MTKDTQKSLENCFFKHTMFYNFFENPNRLRAPLRKTSYFLSGPTTKGGGVRGGKGMKFEFKSGIIK